LWAILDPVSNGSERAQFQAPKSVALQMRVSPQLLHGVAAGDFGGVVNNRGFEFNITN